MDLKVNSKEVRIQVAVKLWLVLRETYSVRQVKILGETGCVSLDLNDLGENLSFMVQAIC